MTLQELIKAWCKSESDYSDTFIKYNPIDRMKGQAKKELKEIDKETKLIEKKIKRIALKLTDSEWNIQAGQCDFTRQDWID